MAPGGYMVVLNTKTGQTNNVFGKKMPQWLIEQKKKSSRNVKRGLKQKNDKSLKELFGKEVRIYDVPKK